MKNIVINILQRSRDLICNDSSKLNLISLILVSIIMYRFIRSLSFDIGLLSLIISFLISFAISNLFLDKFTYSKFMYIRIIQRFVIYILIFIIGSFAYFYILKFFNLIETIYCCSGHDNISGSGSGSGSLTGNSTKDKVNKLIEITTDTDKDMYSLKISKELVHKGIQNVVTIGQMATEKVVGNVGVGTAAGTAAGSAIKYSVGMPPFQRLLVVGGTASVTAAGTKLGLEVAETLSKNINIKESIKNSPHGDTQLDRIPSPDSDFINSPLENDITSPLQDLLYYSFILDILILILLIGILVIIFNRYILKYNLTLINSIVNKYMPINIRNWFNINIGIEFNNKLVLVIFIINLICLFFFIFLKLLISSTLLVDIDSYITVHLYIHGKKSSILLFISTTYQQNRFHYFNVPIRYFRTNNII